MLDPNLRFDVQEDTSGLQNTGIVNLQPLLRWLDKRGIVYFWCDHHQYHTSEKIADHTRKGIEGWDTWAEYKIHIYPPQIQFLKTADYAITKISWLGVYHFVKNEQQPSSMKGIFRADDRE